VQPASAFLVNGVDGLIPRASSRLPRVSEEPYAATEGTSEAPRGHLSAGVA